MQDSADRRSRTRRLCSGCALRSDAPYILTVTATAFRLTFFAAPKNPYSLGESQVDQAVEQNYQALSISKMGF